MGVYTFKGHILVGGAISTVQVQFFRLFDFKNRPNRLQIRLKEYLRLTQTKSEKMSMYYIQSTFFNLVPLQVKYFARRVLEFFQAFDITDKFNSNPTQKL